jgi:hypothetical protein
MAFPPHVIPREGVESVFVTFGAQAFVTEVIPREGVVEGNLADRVFYFADVLPVIP